MPSSYSSNLLLELMADGENEGLWGDITNENLEILGRAAGGVGTITLAGTTHTLTIAQGNLSEGHYATLVLGGSPTGTNTITIQPNTVTRTFLVQNSSGQDAVFTQGSGGNVTVPNGGTAIVFCSGSGASSSVTDITADFLRGVKNLSDLDDPDTALQNLGLTATAAEINKLDGATLDLAAVTATAAEVNVLDGSTATTGDLNKLAGVTATAAEVNVLDGSTATTADLNKLADVTATAAEINKLDGVTATTSELNAVDGVTGPIQTQLDGKYEASTQSTSAWETGTSTTESLVSPAKIKAAAESLGGPAAWVKFNGTGTVAVVSGKNVDSVTRNGVGDYTVNFESSLSSADYLVSVTVTGDPVSSLRYAQTGSVHPSTAPSVDAVRVATGYSGSQFSSGKLIDLPFVWVAVWSE